MNWNALLAKMTLDDLVASIFNEASLSEIPSNKERIHSFFFDLVTKENYPKAIQDVLAQLTFGAGDIYPFSRKLESALVRLQIAGLISANNPDYRKYSIDQMQREKIKKRFNTFHESERDTILKIADEFKLQIQLGGTTH